MKRSLLALAVVLILLAAVWGVYTFTGRGDQHQNHPIVQSDSTSSDAQPMMHGDSGGGSGMSDMHAAASNEKTESAVCPVMNNSIPDVTKAAGKSVYKGKTYYFCCGGCKPMFDKNPEKYVNKT